MLVGSIYDARSDAVSHWLTGEPTGPIICGRVEK
jgi:hypothetical protein